MTFPIGTLALASLTVTTLNPALPSCAAAVVESILRTLGIATVVEPFEKNTFIVEPRFCLFFRCFHCES